MNSASSAYQPTPDDILLPGGEDPLHTFVRVIHKITPRVYVAKLLVLVNVLVFAAMVAGGVNFTLPTAADALAWGASAANPTMFGQWWRLFTCMFVHFGIIHLALNMWVLWQLGPLAERLMGNIGFLLMYVISGLIGSLAGLFWNPLSVGAGASGAVFGVAGAVLAFTLLQKRTIPLVAFSGIKSSMVAFVGYNMLFGFVVNAAAKPGGMAIGMATHTGGLIAGMVCGALLSQPIELAARGRRWWHNLTMLIVGVVAIGCGIRYMPAGAADFSKAVDTLNAVQPPTLTKFQTLVQQINSRELDGPAFANAVEQDVIGPWHELSVQFSSIAGLPPQAQAQADRIKKYLEARGKSFQMAVDAARENRDTKVREFQNQYDQANKLWAEIVK